MLPRTLVLLAPTPAPAEPSAGDEYPTLALVRALAARHRRGTDLDGALALWVARARAADEPVERVLAALERLLRQHVRPLHPDDDLEAVRALVLRRAITAYHRDAAGESAA
jgi:hypothetical protein